MRLKETARGKRGKGARIKVTVDGKLPKNWESFLRDNNNKSELFVLIADVICHSEFDKDKVVISTWKEGVVVSPAAGPDDTVIRSEYPLSDCNHEEFDTRVMLHAANAVEQGYKRLMIRASDTDVVVLAISFFSKIAADKLWIAFGMGKKFRYIPIHDICQSMTPSRVLALPAFHALSGSDTTSFFSGTGKKTAFEKWSTRPELTPVLCRLMGRPQQISEDDVIAIERFVVSLYSVSCPFTDVNKARQQIFAHSSRGFEYLPPSKAALVEHVKRVTYQAGFVWGQSLVTKPELPSPGSWGWIETELGWEPYWTPLPRAAKALEELVKCQCRVRCTGSCSCYSKGLRCTARCKCGGTCYARPGPLP